MLSSLRNFFLALFISLVVFGISAYFLLNFIEDTSKGFINPVADETTDNSGETEVTTEPSENMGEILDTSEFTAVIMGIDSGLSQTDGKPEADIIILVNINAKTKILMISPLSCDMKVEVKGYMLRLGDVYAEFDAETAVQTVRGHTGLQADYYCVLDYESIEKIFEILGEMEFDVSMNMFYDPYIDEPTTEAETAEPVEINPEETTNDYERIDLKSGKQTIDAAKAIQLLRYKNYSNGNYDRMDAQMEFIKELLKQIFTFEDLINAKEIYEKIKESAAETNMDGKDLEKYAETFFSLPEYTIVDISYPGTPEVQNGLTLFAPDIKSAINRYKPYRKGVENIESAANTEETETTEGIEIIG